MPSTIELRAKTAYLRSNQQGLTVESAHKIGYIQGATEQKTIDDEVWIKNMAYVRLKNQELNKKDNIWHTMDEEPLETGVILYSDRANRIYDGSYIGGGRFDVDRMSVPAGNFTLWCQRSEFFKESGLRKSLDKLEE